jgi:hypothetical protein
MNHYSLDDIEEGLVDPDNPPFPNKNDVRVGMRVLIFQRQISKTYGWQNDWYAPGKNRGMDAYINNGRTYTVVGVNEHGVRFAEDEEYHWPWRSLMPAPD